MLQRLPQQDERAVKIVQTLFPADIELHGAPSPFAARLYTADHGK